MKYQQLCDGIIAKVGGRDNVLDVSHCITRLRFHLKDESLAQTDELKAMKGVVDVIQAGGQYQVVIGATVESVYNELVQIGGFDAKPALDIDRATMSRRAIRSRAYSPSFPRSCNRFLACLWPVASSSRCSPSARLPVGSPRTAIPM